MKDQPPLITVIIPTLYAPPTLAATLHTFAQQTLSVRFQLIDTGTASRDYHPWRKAVTKIPNVDVSQIQPTRPEHPSHVIAHAIDLGCDLAQTPFVVLTHDDVWLNHYSVLAGLFQTMNATSNPIIGYEMSPRSHLTEEWRGMVSHTLTLIDLKWFRDRELRWDMSNALPPIWKGETKPGWPDTETALGRELKSRNIGPHFIGHETNELHFVDEHITHRRSLTSHRLYQPTMQTPDAEWIDQEVAKALQL